MTIGGSVLSKKLGLDLSKNYNMIVMVDRRKRIINVHYQYRILGISVKIDSLIQQFNYEECIKRECGYFEISLKNTNEYINAIKLPCILDYSFDGKNVHRIQRGLNKHDYEYYEHMKEQYDIGDSELVDDGLLHFYVI